MRIFKSSLVVVAASFVMVVPLEAMAQKVCVKATLNKASGKIALSKSTSTTSCTSGSVEIEDLSKISSGVTVRGVIGGYGTQGTLAFFPISLPKGAPVALKDADVMVANTASLPDLLANCDGLDCLSTAEQSKARSGCTGTFDNPTAPSGKLCVYIDVNFGAYDIEVQSIARVANPAGGSKYGAGLQWSTVTGLASSKVKAAWAYKAP